MRRRRHQQQRRRRSGRRCHRARWAGGRQAPRRRTRHLNVRLRRRRWPHAHVKGDRPAGGGGCRPRRVRRAPAAHGRHCCCHVLPLLRLGQDSQAPSTTLSNVRHWDTTAASMQLVNPCSCCTSTTTTPQQQHPAQHLHFGHTYSSLHYLIIHRNNNSKQS